MTDVNDDDVVSEYRTSLVELQFNSKPHINMLTMLADESRRCSGRIVQLIEDRLFEVASVNQKLPILYLIDSIVKNCPDAPYKELFGKNLVADFVHVFEQADEKIRQSLFKLRLTWVDVFPASKLYRIDIKVHEIDPAWPLQDAAPLKVPNAAGARSNVYVNPKFMEIDKQAEGSKPQYDKPYANSEKASRVELKRLQEELQSERKSIIGKSQEFSTARGPSSVEPIDVGLPVPTDPRIRKKELAMQVAASKPISEESDVANIADVIPDLQDEDFITIDVALGAETIDLVDEEVVLLPSRENYPDNLAASRDQPRMNHRKDEYGRRNRSDYTSPPRKKSVSRQAFNRAGLSRDSSPPRRARRDNAPADYRTSSVRHAPKARNYQSHRRSRFDVRPEEAMTLSNSPPPAYEMNKMPIEPIIEPCYQPFLDPRLQARMSQPGEWSDGRGPGMGAMPMNPMMPPSRRGGVHGGGPKMPINDGMGNMYPRVSPLNYGPLAFSNPHVSDAMAYKSNHFVPILDRSYAEQAMSAFSAAAQSLRGSANVMDTSDVRRFGTSAFVEQAPPAPPAPPPPPPVPPTVVAAAAAAPGALGAGSVVCNVDWSTAAKLEANVARDSNLSTAVNPFITVMPERVEVDSPMNNRLFVDGLAYEVRFVDEVAVIERNGLPHRIYFVGSDRDVVVDGVPYSLCFSEPRTVIIDGQPIAFHFGSPSRELYIGNTPLKACFGGGPVSVFINQVKHKIQLCGPPPEVKIDPEPAYELIRYMSYNKAKQRGEQDVLPTSVADASQMRGSVAASQAPAVGTLPPANVSTENVIDLLDKLVKSGIIEECNVSKTSATATQAQQAPQALSLAPAVSVGQTSSINTFDDSAERRLSPTAELKSFNLNCLKIRYSSVIDSLHQNKIQCSTCGMRFPVDENAKYAKHLDWHFKMNRRGKFSRGAVSRPWFLALEDVINYEELGEDISTKVKSSVFESLQKKRDKSNNDLKKLTESVAVATDFEHHCGVCHELLEQFFDREDQTWKLRNAITVDEKTYHPLCYKDIAPSKFRTTKGSSTTSNSLNDTNNKTTTTTTVKSEEGEEVCGDAVAQMTSSADIIQSILSVFRQASTGERAEDDKVSHPVGALNDGDRGNIRIKEEVNWSQ